MKITVELPDSDINEICRVTGESKKGPAIRKLVMDALMLKRREMRVHKFITGEWGVALKGFEAAQAADRKADCQGEERLERLMSTLIDTSLWVDFTRTRSPRKNITVNSLDLLIATIALHHGAEVVTFDDDFQEIASVSNLQVRLLKRPSTRL